MPKWVRPAWAPENLEVLDYEWSEVAIPNWRRLADFARERGVRLSVEPCFSQLVHNPSTMHRLIQSAGDDVVGANLDPSHLMGMGADIPTVIRALGGSISHVHAKDPRISSHVADREGLLDTVPMTDPAHRAWKYVALGHGQPAGETFWADVVYTLRSVGYDGTLTIEHEDILMNSVEGVGRAADLLTRTVLSEAPDWAPANVGAVRATAPQSFSKRPTVRSWAAGDGPAGGVLRRTRDGATRGQEAAGGVADVVGSGAGGWSAGVGPARSRWRGDDGRC